MTFKQATWPEPLLSEQSSRGRRGAIFHVDEKLKDIYGHAEDFVPEKLRRTKLELPCLSEPQVVRHFVRLSQMNFGVDLGMYPLGSCTMKYNPKISERLASNIKMLNAHPLQLPGSCQGVLAILYELSAMLAEITGTTRVSLAPAAGAQGEYAGALITCAFLRDKGELDRRREMLIPDSAHGTNPASAAMAGFKVVKVPSGKDGLVDIHAVREMVSDKTAGMMLTVPNTLGLFERRIEEISKLVHDAGGLMYYDGANMNALLGRVRPGDMGFDIVHLNLHKTFSTPHGGGGPGAGPIGVASHLVDYLPIPLVEKGPRGYYLKEEVPKTIGRVKGFAGNAAILLRAYVYILLYGRDGLPNISAQSVLAANYLMKKLDESIYSRPYQGDIPCKHEFVVSGKNLARRTTVKALDVAKAVLDYSVHAPTIYFPLIVDECLMIEPTETEPVENLDYFAQSLNEIGKIAERHPQEILNTPRNTAIGRLDEAKASHPLTMTYSWRKIKQQKTSKF